MAKESFGREKIEEPRRVIKANFNDKKRISQTLKISSYAGQAKVGPVLSPVFGQHQLNLTDFCKEFNRLTSNYNAGLLFLVFVHKYSDKTFLVELRGLSSIFTLNQLKFQLQVSSKFLLHGLLFFIAYGQLCNFVFDNLSLLNLTGVLNRFYSLSLTHNYQSNLRYFVKIIHSIFGSLRSFSCCVY